MVVIGDKIEGKKVVGYLCSCKHPKSNHAAREKIGTRTRVGDHYETSIIFEKNMGKCTESGCKCKGYKKGAVLLDDGSALSNAQFFKCDECGEYLNKKKKSKDQYWPTLCKACVPVYYSRRISEADVNILELEEIKKYLIKNYPAQIEKIAEIKKDDWDAGPSYIEASMLLVINTRLSDFREKKEEWKRYI